MMATISSLVMDASSCRGGAGVQIPPDGPLAGAEGCGDFRHGKPLVTEFPGPARSGLRRSPGPTLVNALLAGDGDACGLPLPAKLQFDLRKAEHDCGDHATDRARQVDLLRHHDDPQ